MFKQDFTCPALLKAIFYYLPIRGYHSLWPAFPCSSGLVKNNTGLFRVRSPLLTEYLFLQVLRCFSSLGSLLQAMNSLESNLERLGFPIRKSRVKLIDSKPELIAVYHVLHRLFMPRHPPNALTRLNY